MHVGYGRLAGSKQSAADKTPTDKARQQIRLVYILRECSKVPSYEPRGRSAGIQQKGVFAGVVQNSKRRRHQRRSGAQSRAAGQSRQEKTGCGKEMVAAPADSEVVVQLICLLLHGVLGCFIAPLSKVGGHSPLQGSLVQSQHPSKPCARQLRRPSTLS